MNWASRELLSIFPFLKDKSPWLKATAIVALIVGVDFLLRRAFLEAVLAFAYFGAVMVVTSVGGT